MTHKTTRSLALALVALLLAGTFLALVNVARASETLYVASMYDVSRGPLYGWQNVSSEEFRAVSFQFNPAYYDTSAYTNESIAFSAVRVRYNIDQGNVLLKLVTEFKNMRREYQTRTIINGTDYYNQTTIVDKPTCLWGVCSSSWRVCSQSSYATPRLGQPGYATISTAQACETRAATFGPTGVDHYVSVQSVTAGRPDISDIYGVEAPGPVGGGYESADGYASTGLNFKASRPANQTNHTNAYTLTANAISRDTTSIEINYKFATWARAEDDFWTSKNATEINRGSFENMMGAIFGAVRGVLDLLLLQVPGGSEAATFAATVISVLLGIPLFVVTMFVNGPVDFVLLHTCMFTCWGTVRYAASDAEVSVIAETAVKPWVLLAKFTAKFSVWGLERLIALGQLVASNTAILVTVAAVAVGAGILAFVGSG